MFEHLYTKQIKLKEDYKEAQTEDEKNKIIEAYEKINSEIKAMDTLMQFIWFAYCESKEKNNTYLDFSEVIWENEVIPLVETLKKLGVETFTFSSKWSGAVNIAWLFQENGYEVNGLVKINKSLSWDGSFETTPAYQFNLKKSQK